jgi:hypothetical protein
MLVDRCYDAITCDATDGHASVHNAIDRHVTNHLGAL